MSLEKHCLIEDLRNEPTSNQIIVCNNSICKKGYFKLSVDLLDSDLDISAIFVYSYVQSYNTSSKECFASSNTIGENLGLTISEVESGLKELRDIGWLEIIKNEETLGRELKITL